MPKHSNDIYKNMHINWKGIFKLCAFYQRW